MYAVGTMSDENFKWYISSLSTKLCTQHIALDKWRYQVNIFGLIVCNRAIVYKAKLSLTVVVHMIITDQCNQREG